jgi:hypothetical protein
MLEDISALSDLNMIGGDLYIYNTALDCLNGLENIDPVSIDNIYIWSNPYLSDCAASSICEYLVSPNGTIDIHDNALGCNNQEEVQAACNGVVVNEISSKPRISISPNPVLESACISYDRLVTGPVRLYILNSTGTIVFERNLSKCTNYTEVNMGNFPAGVYLCRLVTGNVILTKKIIKQ